MSEIRDLIKKKIAGLLSEDAPVIQPTEKPLIAPNSIPAPIISDAPGIGEGMVTPPPAETEFVPQLNNPANKFSAVPVINPDIVASPNAPDISALMKGRIEMPAPVIESLPTRPRIVANQADNAPVIEPVLSPLEQTEKELYRRQNKNWKVKQKDGGDGDNDHNWWDVVKNAGLGFARGGIGGAISGAISGAVDENTDEKFFNDMQLGRLQNQFGVQSKIADDKLGREYKQAQLGDIKDRPAKEKRAQEFKFIQEAQKQINRLQVLQAKEASEGKKWKLETRDGKYYKKYADREEPLIDSTTGEQEIDLINRPEAVQVEDGVNADGTKKYKTVYVKGGQSANLEASKNYRDAVLALSKDRLEETKRSNQVRETLSREKFEVGKEQFNKTLSLRATAQANLIARQQAGDAQGAAKFQLELDKYDVTLEKMQTAAREADDLTDEQKLEIEEFVRTKRAK